MVTARIPPSSMGKTRVLVQVAMVLLDDPTAGKPIIRLRITHYPPGYSFCSVYPASARSA